LCRCREFCRRHGLTGYEPWIDPDWIEDTLKQLRPIHTGQAEPVFGLHPEGIWQHELTARMEPIELWRTRTRQRTFLSRYGRRGDLLPLGAQIPELNEGLLDLVELLEEEGDSIDSGVRKLQNDR